MNIAFLKHGFQVMASWWLKTMLKMSTLPFHAGIAGERFLVPYIFFHHGSDWCHLPSFPMRHPSRAAIRCVFAGNIYGSCMMVLHHIFFLQLGNYWKCFCDNGLSELDQQKACSFPWFKSLSFLSLVTPEAYHLCYRSQRRPGFANTRQSRFVMIRTTPGIFEWVRQ